MKRLPEKGTRESVVLSFGFTNEAGAISNPTFEVLVDSQITTDADPMAILDGDPQVDGTKVLQRVSGGVAEVNYQILCTVDTDSGDTLTFPLLLPVRAIPC